MTTKNINVSATVTVRVVINGTYYDLTLDEAKALRTQISAAITSVSPPATSGGWYDR